MANRTQLSVEVHKLAALQAAASNESQRHLLARIDDLTRRSIELHAEVILREQEIAGLKARIAELEEAAKPKPAKKAAAKKTAAPRRRS